MKWAKNQVELAHNLAVSRRTINAWARLDGAPRAKSDGRIDIEAWKQFISINNLKESETPDYAAAKARLMSARAERAEFENEVRKALFVHGDDVRRLFTRSVVTAKGRLMSIPAALAQVLAMCSDPVDVEQRVKVAMTDALDGLSKSEFYGCKCQKCGEEIR